MAKAGGAGGGGGPLNPPAGSVAPSGRTLDEVYNRVAASGDGVPRIGPEIFNLSAPGQYQLTAPKSGLGAMMLIEGPNITLDLNGHTLTSTSITSGVIEITGAHANVTIRNGTLVGGNHGVVCGSPLTNLWLEDLKFIGHRLTAVQTSHAIIRGTTLINCHAWNIGAASVPADNALSLCGFAIGGSYILVKGCSVRRFVYNGTGTPTVFGINLHTEQANGGFNQVVDSCIAARDGALGTTIGIRLAGSGNYRNNTSTGFATAYAPSPAVNAGGNF